MNKFSKKNLAYGLLLVTLTATSLTHQVYADDAAMPVTAPTTNSVVAPTMMNGTFTSKAQPQSQTLGTLPADGSMPPSPATDVSPVAPLPMSDTSMDILPQQKVGDITYITGGIGDEERAALSAAKKDYNVYIMSSNKNGTFIGDEEITIRDAKGSVLLNVAAGPLLYLKLPSGAYSLEAMKGEETKKQKITIGTKGASNIQFSW